MNLIGEIAVLDNVEMSANINNSPIQRILPLFLNMMKVARTTWKPQHLQYSSD